MNNETKREPEQIEIWKWLNKYVTFVYNHPLVILLLSLSFLAAMSLWLLIKFGISVNAWVPFYRYFGGKVLDRFDSYVSGRKQTYYCQNEKNSKTIQQATLSQIINKGVIVYERRGQNILTVDSLREIWYLENNLSADPSWPKYCFKPNYTSPYGIDPFTRCENTISLINVIKSTIMWKKMKFNPQPSDLTEDIIPMVLTNETIAGFLGRDTTVENQYSSVLRTIINFGTPQENYYNAADRAKEQNDNYKKWGKSYIKPIKNFLKKSPFGVKAYQYIPGPIDDAIESTVLKQVYWLIGSFGFLIVFSIFHMKTVFVSLLGILGIFFAIPCSIITMKGILTIEHFDALNVIGLFLICGIGSDCLFILFDLVVQSEHFGTLTPEKRLGWAVQHGLIALATSLGTAAISFLALMSADFRVMQFFGIFCFLELFYDFIFTFTWYVAVLALYIKYFEKKSYCMGNKNSLNYESMSATPVLSEFNTNEGIIHILIEEYPDNNWYDCFKKLPTFCVNASGLDIYCYNIWERFFHNYLAPFIYFYRAIIVLSFLALTIVMTYFMLQMKSSFEIQFLSNDDALQRGYTLIQNAFATAYLDFSYIYTWGTTGKVKRNITDLWTVDGWGTTTFEEMDFSDPDLQQTILDACDMVENDNTFIDNSVPADFICPIRLLRDYAKDKYSHFPLQRDEYNEILSGFRENLSYTLGLNEPSTELFVGTSNRNTIGFSYKTDDIVYMSIKAPMKLPKDRSSDSLHKIYDKASNISKSIAKLTPDGYSKGYSTSIAWTQMVTEDKLEPQAIIDVATSILFASVCIFISTLSFSYTVFVAYSMISVILTIIGILYLSGWKIGVPESIMISIAAGYCADFIIQPMLAMAHDASSLSVFGRLQMSITMFASPVSSALCTTVVAAAFLFPSEIIIFKPFATFLCMSGGFGIVYGFIVLPAVCAWIGPKNSDSLRRCCKKKGEAV